MNGDQPYPRELTREYQDERTNNKELIEVMLSKRDVLDAVERAYCNAELSAKKYIDVCTPEKEYKEAFDKVLDAMHSPEPFES